MNNRVDDTAPSRGATGVRFEIMFASMLLAFGLFVLPALIYAVGTVLLGAYLETAPGNSLAVFYRTFFADLAAPSARAWLIAVGPLLVSALFRLVFVGHRADDASPPPPPRTEPPTRRAAPVARPAPSRAAKQPASRNGRRVEPRIGSD